MNIQKMIEKLDVLQKEDECNIPDYDILREILEAGREPEQKKDTIEIDRKVAELWLNAFDKSTVKGMYCNMISNEIRKALNERK